MPATLPLGVNFSEPWKLLAHHASNAVRFTIYGNGGSAALVATNITFWSQFNERGYSTNASFTANTYNTVYTHTGKGYVATVVSPTASNSGTMTFEFVVDGATNEIAIIVNDGERVALGILHNSGFGISEDGATGMSGGSSNQYVTTAQMISTVSMPNWHAIQYMGTPVLQYNIGFSLRIKFTSDITATTDNRRYAGLIARQAAY